MCQAKYAWILLALTIITVRAQDGIYLSRQVHQALTRRTCTALGLRSPLRGCIAEYMCHTLKMCRLDKFRALPCWPW